MARKSRRATVEAGFEEACALIALDQIQPLRMVSEAHKKSPRYQQIVTSISEVGIVEPPVVARDRREPGKYLLLDGHLRIAALKERGVQEVVCLIAKDDEAVTYNRRINRLAIIQEHRMIRRALARGVSEERLAKTLNLDVGSIQRRCRLLDGICAEAADILRDKHVPMQSLTELKRLQPVRQIEAAELMVAMNKYTTSYARSLVAATPEAQLVESRKPRRRSGLSEEQAQLMARESTSLDRELRVIEQSYRADHLELVLARGFVSKLLGSAKVVRYLAMHQPEILSELQRMTSAPPT